MIAITTIHIRPPPLFSLIIIIRFSLRAHKVTTRVIRAFRAIRVIRVNDLTDLGFGKLRELECEVGEITLHRTIPNIRQQSK